VNIDASKNNTLQLRNEHLSKTGILVADAILQALTLRVSRYQFFKSIRYDYDICRYLAFFRYFVSMAVILQGCYLRNDDDPHKWPATSSDSYPDAIYESGREGEKIGFY